MPVHVGQQAIVAADGHPIGYELLFRASGGTTHAAVRDQQAATAQVLVATFLEFGLHRLVGDALAFVNLPRPFLTGELPLPFDAGQVVLEVLEDVPADADVIAGLTQLARQGHRIALDDVTAQRNRHELLHLADYVKIDLLDTDQTDLPELVGRCGGQGRRVVAEKVETVEQLQMCQALGVELFQGYLPGRPRTLTQPGLSPNQLACVRLLGLLSEPDVRTDDVVTALHADPSLAIKVLQAANSAAAGLVRRPGSVREAVVHVGLQRLQAWATLIGLAAEGNRVPLGTALRRARMCQLLADSSALEASAFLTGLLSGLTGALEVSTDVLLTQVPVAAPVSAALLGQQGPLGAVLAIALAYEAGPHATPPVNWPATTDQLLAAYLDAQAWSMHNAELVAAG